MRSLLAREETCARRVRSDTRHVASFARIQPALDPHLQEVLRTEVFLDDEDELASATAAHLAIHGSTEPHDLRRDGSRLRSTSSSSIGEFSSAHHHDANTSVAADDIKSATDRENAASLTAASTYMDRWNLRLINLLYLLCLGRPQVRSKQARPVLWLIPDPSTNHQYPSIASVLVADCVRVCFFRTSCLVVAASCLVTCKGAPGGLCACSQEQKALLLEQPRASLSVNLLGTFVRHLGVFAGAYMHACMQACQSGFVCLF